MTSALSLTVAFEGAIPINSLNDFASVVEDMFAVGFFLCDDILNVKRIVE